MRVVDLITRKRDGGELSAEELDFFVQNYTRGTIPDYQAAAWLMAVLFQGMSNQECVDLTLSMARSGDVLDLSDVAPFVVDKHSSGGVGDKTTLVVAPLVASLGIFVGKMSGRGLGFSGGTLDKLESIPGYRTLLTIDQLKKQLRDIGVVVTGQTANIAPADGKLYALRDVTGTVQSLPLIASSIMSKKLATGSNGTVLDVKTGRGAFMRTEEEAIALAEIMVDIGVGAGRKVVAIVADMSQPLGNAVGNALEVLEAIEIVQGGGPADFLEHCLVISSQMVLMAGKADSEPEARQLLQNSLASGAAWDKFVEWIGAQGGDTAYVHDPRWLTMGTFVAPIPSPQTGYVSAVDALEVGLSVMDLGGGRAKKGDKIDDKVGCTLEAKVGDYVSEGEPLCLVHARTSDDIQRVESRLQDAYSFSDQPQSPPPLVRCVVTSEGRRGECMPQC